MLTKNQEKLIRSLSVRKNRKKTGLFVAEGMKLVTDFLNSGLVAENIFVV
ncbi:MAG: RNA methyltransferase, partial [Schleiferiaceae bacterium]